MRPAFIRSVFVLLLAPLAFGYLIVTYRDAGVTHLPGRIAVAEQIRAGQLPLINPYASCGEPLAGNPNFGVFFPDTLLSIVLPANVAFGAHFALAWVLAWVGARRWARREGFSREASEVAAYAFALSGPFLSAWSFYNAGMALAVGVWALAAAAKIARKSGGSDRSRRAVAELGIAGGLTVLAGEPVVAAIVAVAVAARLVVGERGFVRTALYGATAALLAAMVAAPQLLATMQAARGSSRDLAGYNFQGATATSVHPMRLLEQAAAFPFGRPDLMGAGGFAGHRYFQGQAPYLWTLHLGWIPLLLAVAFARPWARGERLWWSMALFGSVLSLGAYLPFAEAIYRVLSLGGKVRYPVKWWYLVALAMVPIVARAARDWLAAAPLRRARVVGSAASLAVLGTIAIWYSRGDVTLLAGIGPSLAGAGLLFATFGLPVPRRRPQLLMAVTAFVPLVVAAPLLLALFDRPPRVATLATDGRIFERVAAQAHAADLRDAEPQLTTREFFRRGPRELWAVTGAAAGLRYAFDRDPDGSYSFWDRIMREATDATPWPERAALLRVAGVSSVVTRDVLGEPFRERAILDPARGVRVYDLPGALPAVRLVGGIVRAPHFNATLAIFRNPAFDPATTTVLPGHEPAAEGEPSTGRVEVTADLPAELVATTELDRPGVLVWQRSYFPAWRAEIDGAPVPTVAADGHLVAVAVPAGRHDVQIVWPGNPVTLGLGLAALGLFSATLVARRWNQRIVRRFRRAT